MHTVLINALKGVAYTILNTKLVMMDLNMQLYLAALLDVVLYNVRDAISMP